MKKNRWLLSGLAAGILIGTGIALYITELSRAKKRKNRIADEGYETAADILFPGKRRDRRVHYGPVVD